MTVRNNIIHSYQDIKDLLRRAYESDRGIAIEAESIGAARNLVQRFNMFRKKDRELNSKAYPDPDHPMHNASIYDSIAFTIEEGANGVEVGLRKSSGDQFKVREL